VGDECDSDATQAELFSSSGNEIFGLSLLVLPCRIDPTSADSSKWLQLADEQYSGQTLRDAVSQFNEQQLLISIEPFESTKRSLD
jgi:hypothetical protein